MADVSLGIWDFVLICLACGVTASGAIALTLALTARRQGQTQSSGSTGEIRFLDGRIVECDPKFQDQLDMDGWNGFASDLGDYFTFRFADLPEGFPDYTRDGQWTYHAHTPDDLADLTATVHRGVTTLSIADPASDMAMPDHLDRYRDYIRQMARWTMDQTPHPSWITDRAGRVVWSNPAYQKLRDSVVLPDGDHTLLTQPLGDGPFADRHQNRRAVTLRDGSAQRWFDVSQTFKRGLTLYQATEVTAVVKAETAQRAFVQTLTKTFAQLSTGLAIFDRNRRLALFNPALIDLTSLSAEFLSARPDHLTFFDKLRDEKLMPEPRNYASWRDQIIDLIALAEDGKYQETWSLPKGNTYRVTGRPHPNGAVAFLFEDISAEVTLTRRFREQLDLSQAVLESLDDALAVFSPQGVLSYTNEAYRTLWQMDPDRTHLDQRVNDVTLQWQKVSGPDPTWGDFRDFAVGFVDRCEWDARVRMQDGRLLDCRFKPLQGGATLATFRANPVAQLHEIGRQG